jgi:hypothetical protein
VVGGVNSARSLERRYRPRHGAAFALERVSQRRERGARIVFASRPTCGAEFT